MEGAELVGGLVGVDSDFDRGVAYLWQFDEAVGDIRVDNKVVVARRLVAQPAFVVVRDLHTGLLPMGFERHGRFDCRSILHFADRTFFGH